MIPLFLGISALNIVMLTTCLRLGYGVSHGRPWASLPVVRSAGDHRGCGVHCVVFTYFMATAKWVQHAILVKHLDPQLAEPRDRSRRKASPPPCSRWAAPAWRIYRRRDVRYQLRPIYHHVAALLALCVNCVAAAGCIAISGMVV